MVQNDSSNSGDESGLLHEQPPHRKPNPPKGVPEGKYRLVGWSVDTTGRRLIDEICQIATYTPKTQFSQYIMPFTDFNPSYSRRHNIKVINTVKYRRLKDLKTNSFVKTKSEVSALTEFIEWLEGIQGDASDGIILVYHEIPKASPGMLLESLRRYDSLVERFQKVVKGFANGFTIAEAKCGNTTKSFGLKVMSKVLLNSDEENFSSAVDRAKMSYDIAVHLAQGERLDLDARASGDCMGVEPHIIEFICPFTNPISAEEDEIVEFKMLLEIQNTFRPVFGALMRASRSERRHASHLRRLLAKSNINYEKLKEAYDNDGKEGLERVINNEVENANEKDLEELLEILDCFFDPEKKAVEPKFSPNNNKRPRKKSFNKKRNSNSETNSSPNASSDNPTTDSVSQPITPRSEIQAVEAQ